MKNRYARRSRETRIREVVRYFAVDLAALQAATLSGLNRNTVNRLALRERILHACEVQRRDRRGELLRGTLGRRGRGAYGKTVIFGIFER